jgi:hypothetical protein
LASGRWQAGLPAKQDVRNGSRAGGPQATPLPRSPCLQATAFGFARIAALR